MEPSSSSLLSAQQLLQQEVELYEAAAEQQKGNWGDDSICTYNMYAISFFIS